jgi:hypothetical protein
MSRGLPGKYCGQTPAHAELLRGKCLWKGWEASVGEAGIRADRSRRASWPLEGVWLFL